MSSQGEVNDAIFPVRADFDSSNKGINTVPFGNNELRSSPTTDSDNNKQGEDSDSPEGVSWKDSKAVFQKEQKDRNQSVNFARSVAKEKRRKKNERFIFQKETKRKLTKLPEDILQAVAKKPKPAEIYQIEKDSSNKVERRKSKKKIKKMESESKYGENCQVLILEDEVNKPKKVQESAAEFLKNHLYGNRLQRVSGSKHLTMKSKSSGVMKPAIKFHT